MTIPRVAVIIPAFDAEAFLADAVASVRCQTFEDWELVIVNDGSRDGTGALADELAAADPRVSVVHQENRGLSSARNRGVGTSRAPFLQFLDADDALLPHKLAAQVAFLAEHGDCDVVYGDGVYEDERGQVPVRYPPPRVDLLSELLTRNFILVNAALVRRRAFDTVGGFRERSSTWVEMYGCEDWELWLRMVARGCRLCRSPGIVVRNRWRSDRMSGDELRMKRSALWVLEEAAASQLRDQRSGLLRGQLFYRRCDYGLALIERGAPRTEDAAWKQLLDHARGDGSGHLLRLAAQSGRRGAWARVLLRGAARAVGRLPTLPSRWSARSR